jgi:RND superfamily putative drug exporter
LTGPLYRLAGLCVRRAPVVVALWIVVVVGLVVAGRSIGEDTTDNLTLSGTGSAAAQDLLQAQFPKQAYGSNPIVFFAPHGKLTDSADSQAIDAAVKSLRKAPHVVSVVNPLSNAGKDALSKNKRVAYASVNLDIGPGNIDADEANDVIAAADPAKKAGIEVSAGGYLGQEVSKTTDSKSDAIGLAAAVVILLFAFGTVVAMGLPIATAVLGLAGSLSIIALLSHVFDVPTVGPTLATMIGLGVGIDYALFIVTRHRQLMADGMHPRESAARAAATAGGAVVFAGSTVVIALISLSIAGISIVTSLGQTAAIGVVVAVAAAVTLMPALLGLLGHRIDSLRVPALHRRAQDAHKAHGWMRYADWVARRPWQALVASVVILAVLALPTRLLHLGSQDNAQLPKDTTARQAYDHLTAGFGPGANGPLLIAVNLTKKAQPDQKKINKIDAQEKQLNQQLAAAQNQAEQAALAQGAPPSQAKAIAQQQTASQAAKVSKQEAQLNKQKKELENPASDPRLQSLRKDIAKQPGVKSVTQPLVNGSGDAAVLNAQPTTSPSARATEDLIKHLRDSTIPAATKGQGMTAEVGGTTAAYVDLAEKISSHLVEVIGIVVGLSFILLLLAFRSVVVPLKAAAMNLVSIGAAYGVVVFVIQEGHGAKLIGLDYGIPIVSYVPLLMFAILFGLSMDYEVFLVSRIKEAYVETSDNHRSVVLGLARTGKVITSAALIMVCVFGSFLFNGDPTVKEFGLGLAVAVAVDSTIVRCLLVPAAMILMRQANWWFPSWLGRAVPELGIEGQEYFAARDAAELEAAEKASAAEKDELAPSASKP